MVGHTNATTQLCGRQVDGVLDGWVNLIAKCVALAREDSTGRVTNAGGEAARQRWQKDAELFLAALDETLFEI